MHFLIYFLALILGVEQAFDVISTNLVISKGRGTEANGLMAKWQAFAGWWWWTIKLPIVALAGWMAVAGGASHYVAALLIVMVAIYAWVLWNNYKIAWRQAV